MSDALLPPWIQPQAETTMLIDDSTSVFRAGYAPGLAQRVSYVEPRLQIKQSFRGLRGIERASMLAFLNRAQGKYLTLRAAVGYANRGSFPKTQLLLNNDFRNGTASWTSYGGGDASLSVADQIMRLTVVDKSASIFGITQSFSESSPYLPTIVRAYTRTGRTLTSGVPTFVQNRDAVTGIFGLGAGPGLSEVPAAGFASTQVIAYIQDASGGVLFPGDTLDVGWTSAQPCALVDGGGNMITHSDIVGSTGWVPSGFTVGSAGTNAPDGSATSFALTETATTASHGATQGVTVASASTDYTFSFYVKAGTRSVCAIFISDNSTSTITQYFSLSAITVGSAVTSGSAWINTRATIEDVGSSWRRITLTSRKVVGATVLTLGLYATPSDGTFSYLGSSAAKALEVWRSQLSAQSNSGIASLTTSGPVNALPQTGNSVRIRGLPASTQGLLLSGDMISINGELKIITQQVDSDGSGNGYVHFHPALCRAANDGDGVVINQPMGKFILAENPQWTNNYGVYADVDITLEAINE